MSTTAVAMIRVGTEIVVPGAETINERILRQAERHLGRAKLSGGWVLREATTYHRQCVAAVDVERREKGEKR